MDSATLPALDPTGSEPPTTAYPRVLLVFDARTEDTTPMLQGIAHHGKGRRPWAIFLDDEARAETDTDWLFSQEWNGVISRHTTPALVQACAERGVPLVDLNDTPSFSGVSKIRPDHSAIGTVGAEHLLDAGFRHLAFAGFANVGWSRERHHGFRTAVERAGLSCTAFNVDHPGALTPAWDRQQQLALAAWLRTLPKPLGVMACNDLRALQLIEAARSAGLLMPEEVAVLGANNDAVRCELATPELSSVATNPFQIGLQAAEELARLMACGPEAVCDLRIPPAGVVGRRSTNVLAVTHPGVAAALRYIRAHACEGINVDQVLPHAAMSRAQIEKKFRQHLGRSPQAEIRRVQVLKIRQLLSETDLPLKCVAELTGFDYMEYMSVVFKRTTGLSPGAYRRRHRTPVASEPPGHG